MRTRVITRDIVRKVDLWRKFDKRQHPDIFIHFLSHKNKPFQGWVWLESTKKPKAVKLGNFHSSGDLLTIVETVLKKYPLSRG